MTSVTKAKGGAAPAVMAPKRATYESMAVVGPSGYGKTSALDEIIERYAKEGQGKVWAIDPTGAWIGHRSVIRIWGPKTQAGMSFSMLDSAIVRLMTAGPGMLLCDDADFYYRHPTDVRMQLVIGNRSAQKDMVYVARRPQGLHKDIFQICETLLLFCQRQAYARKYLADELSSDFEKRQIIRMIPREKFQYLHVHRPTATAQVKVTKQRKLIVSSDRV